MRQKNLTELIKTLNEIEVKVKKAIERYECLSFNKKKFVKPFLIREYKLIEKTLDINSKNSFTLNDVSYTKVAHHHKKNETQSYLFFNEEEKLQLAMDDIHCSLSFSVKNKWCAFLKRLNLDVDTQYQCSTIFFWQYKHYCQQANNWSQKIDEHIQILETCHAMNNPSDKQAKDFVQIFKQSPHIIILMLFYVSEENQKETQSVMPEIEEITAKVLQALPSDYFQSYTKEFLKQEIKKIDNITLDYHLKKWDELYEKSTVIALKNQLEKSLPKEKVIKKKLKIIFSA